MNYDLNLSPNVLLNTHIHKFYTYVLGMTCDIELNSTLKGVADYVEYTDPLISFPTKYRFYTNGEYFRMTKKKGKKEYSFYDLETDSECYKHPDPVFSEEGGSVAYLMYIAIQRILLYRTANPTEESIIGITNVRLLIFKNKCGFKIGPALFYAVRFLLHRYNPDLDIPDFENLDEYEYHALGGDDYKTQVLKSKKRREEKLAHAYDRINEMDNKQKKSNETIIQEMQDIAHKNPKKNRNIETESNEVNYVAPKPEFNPHAVLKKSKPEEPVEYDILTERLGVDIMVEEVEKSRKFKATLMIGDDVIKEYTVQNNKDAAKRLAQQDIAKLKIRIEEVD